MTDDGKYLIVKEANHSHNHSLSMVSCCFIYFFAIINLQNVTLLDDGYIIIIIIKCFIDMKQYFYTVHTIIL